MASIWKRLFGKVYTPDQVLTMIAVVLESTFDRGIVNEAISTIDKFDAGAVDSPLRNHIFDTFKIMVANDKISDVKKLRYWIRELNDLAEE